jgi:hypothetical protein
MVASMVCVCAVLIVATFNSIAAQYRSVGDLRRRILTPSSRSSLPVALSVEYHTISNARRGGEYHSVRDASLIFVSLRFRMTMICVNVYGISIREAQDKTPTSKEGCRRTRMADAKWRGRDARSLEIHCSDGYVRREEIVECLRVCVCVFDGLALIHVIHSQHASAEKGSQETPIVYQQFGRKHPCGVRR